MSKGRCSTVLQAALASAFIVASASSLAQGRAATGVKFYIEEQTLVAALNDWSKQSGLQVVWPSRNQAQYGKTVLLQGTFAPMQALELLLRNSGLTYSMINERTVVIKESSPQASSAVGPQKFWRAAADTRPGVPMARSASRPAQIVSNFEASIAEVVVTGTGSNVSFATLGDGANSFNNSAFNLGGLGPGATLTLLNGHRMAPAGNDGALVDISMIPLTAVDHIDVLNDGASAIYGADAVAGVVNIVTRKDFDGAESQVRYGGATDGGADSLRAAQLLGTRWGTGNILLNYEYDRQDRIDALSARSSIRI